MAPRMTAEALSSGYSEPVELPLMRKDGSRFMGEVIISPVRNPSGEITAWVSTIRDVSKRHDYEVELERLARHDPLTGLANRRLFDERLDQEMADAIRHGRSLAVAILDLDGFKAVNDRHGHPAGDRTLREVAKRLLRVLRRGDLLARVGGEEFAWILPEVHSHGAWAAVERARHAISGGPFDGIGELTISIGLALRGALENGAELYERADESLYRAERERRDRSVMWRSAEQAAPRLSAKLRAWASLRYRDGNSGTEQDRVSVGAARPGCGSSRSREPRPSHLGHRHVPLRHRAPRAR